MPTVFQTSNAGKQHMFVKQTQRMSCGCACLSMVFHRKFGKTFSDSEMQAFTKDVDQETSIKKIHSKNDINGNKTGLSNGQYKDLSKHAGGSQGYNLDTGTSAGAMSIVLRKACVNTKPEMSPKILAELENANWENPVIAQVQYISGPTGLMHWVVVDGMDGPNLVVMDPGYGLTEFPITTQYTDKGGNIAKFTGRHIKC